METRLIGKMIDAMRIGKDDVVLLNYWCENEATDLAAFEEAFSERGIAYRKWVFSDEFLQKLVSEYASGLDDEWFDGIRDITLVIDVMDKPAGMPPKGMTEEEYGAFGAVLQSLFVFMSQHEKLIQITMPSKINAALSGENPEDYERKIIQALDVDYDSLRENCRKKAESLRYERLRILSGENCELTMDISGREWNIDAGEGAFPCGEIYIAPLEDKTNGRVYFSKLLLEGVGAFDNVVLTVENGVVVDSDCEAFNTYLAGLEDGARIVGELGIGMNPAVVNSGAGASLDEDALGTFHIGLGMNVMFGGTNACRSHMDFVTEGDIIGMEPHGSKTEGSKRSMEEKISELNHFMVESKASVQETIDRLVADGRADEARPYRAAYNIYDVFAALITAAEKTSGGDESRFAGEFGKLAERVPAGWRQSLAEATKHDNAEKIMIEEAKLKVADEIIAKVGSLFGGDEA